MASSSISTFFSSLSIAAHFFYLRLSLKHISFGSPSRRLAPRRLPISSSPISSSPHLLASQHSALRHFGPPGGLAHPLATKRPRLFYSRPETKEISSCCVEYCPDEEVVVSLFQIPLSQLKAFEEREHEFRLTAVHPVTIDGNEPLNVEAIMCTKYTDEEYRREKIRSESEWYERYGRWGIEKIWRDDILPCRVYLRHCLLAAQKLGQDVYDHFLDHSYLADRKTTIRMYLNNNPHIMNEQPPASLVDRYNG